MSKIHSLVATIESLSLTEALETRQALDHRIASLALESAVPEESAGLEINSDLRAGMQLKNFTP